MAGGGRRHECGAYEQGRARQDTGNPRRYLEGEMTQEGSWVEENVAGGE